MEVTTKVKEFKLMAQGNKAVSYVLGGRLLGLAIVLYSTATNSISLLDMISWGAVGILAQIIVFYLAEWLTPRFNINKSLEEDNQAVGLFLCFIAFNWDCNRWLYNLLKTLRLNVKFLFYTAICRTARLVRANNQWRMNKTPLMKVSLYIR